MIKRPTSIIIRLLSLIFALDKIMRLRFMTSIALIVLGLMFAALFPWQLKYLVDSLLNKIGVGSFTWLLILYGLEPSS